MKGRLTLTLPEEDVCYIKDSAKAKGVTASKFVEDMFLDFIADDERMSELKNNLKKTS